MTIASVKECCSGFRKQFARLWAMFLVCAFLQACATPAAKLTDYAFSQGFERSTVNVGGFDLLVFANQAIRQHKSLDSDDSVLRVYLEGDGSPWKHRTIIMADPTPRSPLMLRLMTLDKNTAVYLGRPCYNGTSSEPECNNSLWTSARYSEPVVHSMASGIRALARQYNTRDIWLFGHSGGGALAMLLAERLSAVSRVVTLAGNLDTDAWTSHHRYTPLYSSLNPAKAKPLRSEITQWHFIGGIDSVIPPQLLQPVIMQQAAASGFLLPSFNHGCCWQRVWPSILQGLEKNSDANLPGKQFKHQIVVENASESL